MPFSLTYIKIIGIGLLALALLGLVGTAKHYHNKWVEAEAAIAAIKVELQAAEDAAKLCSEATLELKKQSDAKVIEVKKAQAKANVLAKKNQSLANKLLSAKPQSSDTCESVKKLYEDYKNETSSGS